MSQRCSSMPWSVRAVAEKAEISRGGYNCKTLVHGAKMIGLFLITHSSLGESLLQCAFHVLNKRPPLMTQLGIAAQDDPLDVLPLARAMLEAVDGGSGVLVLTDIFGATPANIAAKLLEPGRIEGVAGVNLPMLLRAINHREKDMKTLVTRTIAGGRDGVVNMLKH